MSKPAAVDRETASSLNPFICSTGNASTLDMISDTLVEIACLLTRADSPQPDRLWPVFHGMAIALRWESDAISTAIRNGKEPNHV